MARDEEKPVELGPRTKINITVLVLGIGLTSSISLAAGTALSRVSAVEKETSDHAAKIAALDKSREETDKRAAVIASELEMLKRHLDSVESDNKESHKEILRRLDFLQRKQ